MGKKLAVVPSRQVETLRGRGTSAEVSDRQLLECFNARSGAPADAECAFAELVRRHGPMVLGACRQLLRNAHDAEDAFQATFLVLARKAGSIRRPERLAYWLYGVATRVARKTRALEERRRRHEGRETAMGTVEPIRGPGRHELEMIRREQVETLHEELARLPEKYRLAIVLCDLAGLTHAEAARRLCWPSGSLSVRLMRARELLRDRLMRRGLAPASALLATVALAETASAAVPPDLATATVNAALRDLRVAEHESTAGGGSASVSTVSGQVLTLMTRAQLVAAALMALGGVSGLVAIVLSVLIVNSQRRADSPTGPRTIPSADARPEEPIPDRRRLRAGASTPEGLEDENKAHFGDSVDLIRPARSGILAPEPWPDNALGVYQAMVEHAGRDAGAQVRLALWCEANGLFPERLKHLALAILTDRDQPTARGLLGQVSFRGRWRRPEDIGALLDGDTRFSAARSEYAARREQMKNNADAHWRLALWCEQEGLETEAVAHVVAVTRREPAREAAWRRLGYEEHRGRWLRPEQIAVDDSALEAQKKADRYWKPLLAKWKSALTIPDDSKHKSAEANLARVTDPLAVPAIWATFAPGGPGGQTVAARLLGQVDGPAASRALARLAVFGDSADVCRIATGILTRRDLRDVAVLLIDLLAEPIVYEVRSVQGPGSPGVLFVAGKQFNVRRLYTVPPLPDSTIQRLFDPTRPPDGAALVAARLGDNWVRLNLISDGGRLLRNNARAVGNNLERAARATLYAQQQLVNDIILIETYNRAIAMANERVEAPLRALSGQDHGQDREAWRAWWTDQQGYAYEPPRSMSMTRPTLEQEIPLPYDPGYRQITGMSCFAAGTLVRTREGARPIEAIRLGDVVLTQDTKTGALNFAAVLTVYHNKPVGTLRIELADAYGNEPIVATGIHRFWKARQGWVMARDLKPGDEIRTLGGVARVAAVVVDRVQPVFNLEVGENQSFFTGKAAALVHDNSLVQPVTGPFDEMPDLAATVSDR